MIPLVSVIIPTYNRANKIERAITSVLNQTYNNWELIIIDDGSVDNTQDILKKYTDNPKIVIVAQKNQGQSVARNKGISIARGEFISFLDSDDEWLVKKLELQVAIANSHPEFSVFYGDDIVVNDATGEIIPEPEIEKYSGQITKYLIRRNFVPFTSSLISADVLRKCHGFDESMRGGEDYDLWLRISVEYKFLYSPMLCTKYCINGNRISDNYRAVLNANKVSLAKIFNDPRIHLSMYSKWDATTKINARLAKHLLYEGKRTEAMVEYLKYILCMPHKSYGYIGVIKCFFRSV